MLDVERKVVGENFLIGLLFTPFELPLKKWPYSCVKRLEGIHENV